MRKLLKIGSRILIVSMLGGLLFIAASANRADAQTKWAKLLYATDDPVNWLMFGHDFTGHRYAPLDLINKDNVGKMVLKWSSQFGTSESVERSMCSPLVVYGTIYGTGAHNTVFAIDARTGSRKWRRQVNMAAELRGDNTLTNYGLAIHGSALYWVSLDARLYALETGTGRVLWSLKIADHKAGYRGIGAPLPLKEQIITGVAVNNASVRGFIDAYAIGQGKRLWRHYTIPVPGEPGAETWQAESWMGGGGETWMTGCYDPELNMLYWSIGAPEPRYNGDLRPGDNLYTNAIIAINPETGARIWHYQIVPHNIWGFNDTREMMLVDVQWKGEMRKALLMATAGGYLILLDRKTGKFLNAVPYVNNLDWSDGIDGDGRPIMTEVGGKEQFEFSPSSQGARQQSPIAYSRRTNAIYMYRKEGRSTINTQSITYRQGKPYIAAELVEDTAGHDGSALIAINFLTGELLWERPVTSPMIGGVLATEGGLIFTGDEAGYFYAFDEATGELLWTFQTGAPVSGAPVSYRVDKKQQISVIAGNGAMYTFGLFEPLEGNQVKYGFH